MSVLRGGGQNTPYARFSERYPCLQIITLLKQISLINTALVMTNTIVSIQNNKKMSGYRRQNVKQLIHLLLTSLHFQAAFPIQAGVYKNRSLGWGGGVGVGGRWGKNDKI